MSLFIVGLGNPGKEYELTRHNVGFLFVQYLGKNEKFNPGPGPFYIKKTKLGYLVLPTTFMNEAGISILELKKNSLLMKKKN